MTIGFTICSNNYIAEARVLATSFASFHPECSFVIGLVDKKSAQVDYDCGPGVSVLPVADIGLDDLPSLYEKFSIVELNTAVKPSFFRYIFEVMGGEKVIYVDPDVLVTARFDEVLNGLDEANIIITPHMLSPVDDGLVTSDFHILRSGVFNLGFIALSHYAAVRAFLDWWHERVLKYGYKNFAKGMFHDQVWINYVPCFFDKYLILKHPGYNMANWNLHERQLSLDADGRYVVNAVFPLRFFHFSGYYHDVKDRISVYSNRYDFQSRPDLCPIFDAYATQLERFGVAGMKKVEVFGYPRKNLPKRVRSLPAEFRMRVRHALRTLCFGLD